MTETLRLVVERVEQLPPEQQNAIAELIEQELEEREWDEMVAKPASQHLLEHLAAEARREDAAGNTWPSTDRW
jgi:hypothetical protein